MKFKIDARIHLHSRASQDVIEIFFSCFHIELVSNYFESKIYLFFRRENFLHIYRYYMIISLSISRRCFMKSAYVFSLSFGLRDNTYSFSFVSNLEFITFSIVCAQRYLFFYALKFVMPYLYSLIHLSIQTCSLPFSDKYIFSPDTLNQLSFEILARSF